MENTRRTDSFSSNLVLLLLTLRFLGLLSLFLCQFLYNFSFCLFISLTPSRSLSIPRSLLSSLFRFGFANKHDEFKLEHSRANVMYWEPSIFSSMHLFNGCFCVLYNTVIYEAQIIFYASRMMYSGQTLGYNNSFYSFAARLLGLALFFLFSTLILSSSSFHLYGFVSCCCC